MESVKSHPWEIAGLALAVLALFIGFWHVLEIRKVLAKAKAQREVTATQIVELQDIKNTAATQISELRNIKNTAADQIAELQTIKQSLSTRYIGVFPEYYPKIIELIEGADNKIFIICDFPCYAGFSDRKNWLRYKHALERKAAEGKKIRLICFDETLRREVLQEQFFTANANWEEWKEIAANKMRLQALIASYPKESLEQLTKDRFLEMLEGEEKLALVDTFRKAEVTETGISMPFYFWLIDERRAIFAIAGMGEEEHGFSTIDQQLINAFTNMKELHLKEAGSQSVPAAG